MQHVEIKDEPAGEDCEHCGNPMVFKMGRYGKFMACSNFPDCRNTKAIVKEIGVKCPKCNEGNLIERKSKKRRNSFMVVIAILNVTFFLGINQYLVAVLSVKPYWLKRNLKKEFKCNVLNVILRKCPRVKGESCTHSFVLVISELYEKLVYDLRGIF